eukprot:3854329-Prymnesium_polylepis.1
MPSGYRIVLRRRTDPTAALSQDPIARFQNPMLPATSLLRRGAGRTGCRVRGSRSGAPLPAWHETACGMRVTPPCPRRHTPVDTPEVSSCSASAALGRGLLGNL